MNNVIDTLITQNKTNKMTEVTQNLSKVPLQPTVEGRSYSKIQFSRKEFVLRTALLVCTLGIVRCIANVIFQHALEKGKIDLATKAVKFGACDYLEMRDLGELKLLNQKESLKFLAAQIEFDKNKTTGGSQAAYEFIRARDDRRRWELDHSVTQDEIFLEALPNEKMPQVVYYTKSTQIAQGDYQEEHVGYRAFKDRPGILDVISHGIG